METLRNIGSVILVGLTSYAMVSKLVEYIASRPSCNRLLRDWEKKYHSDAILLCGTIDSGVELRIKRQVMRFPSSTKPIDVLLHTPGGSMGSGYAICDALRATRRPVRVFIPYHAMSIGTVIGITATELHMSPAAHVGSIQPQIAVRREAGFDLYSADAIRRFGKSSPGLEGQNIIVKAQLAESDLKIYFDTFSIAKHEPLWTLLTEKHHHEFGIGPAELQTAGALTVHLIQDTEAADIIDAALEGR